MSVPQLVTGDDTDFQFTCQDAAGAAVDISTASEVKLAISSRDRSSTLAGPYTASAVYEGADWEDGIVVVAIPGTDTEALLVNRGEVEVQVVIGGRKTTYFGVQPVEIIKGVIP